ncbi:phosphoribosyltransferase-like protein [Variovorax sp. RT4R15]|uniref:phosphoribosyltransferase-like protein n=1 Tax=Variovorax sp. RT4R15 TaxID=3443737 RepID=UPI003F4981F1
MLSLELLKEVADTLADQHLSQYIEDLDAGAARRLKRKDINDALWGTVSLSPAEVAVLDSPLLQRLRFLRQMGVAHWVYPGAVHTRFEHAIGALHQTQRLVESLNAQVVRHDSAPLVTTQDAQLLRLSSLFSHVGCLAFSDSVVLELKAHPDLAMVTKDFATDSDLQELGAEPSLCQLLAHYIIQSPAVRALLQILVKSGLLPMEKGNDEERVEIAIRFMALAVIGRRVDELRPQLQELVNGPFDASTLDTLVRDAKFSGIPSVLDSSRLMQKLTGKALRLDALPDWMNQGLFFAVDPQAPPPTMWLFGVPSNATPILNELQLAQVLVTTKIHRHPKVLATEQMLRSVVHTFGELSTAKELLTLLYSTSEDVLLSLSAGAFETALHRASTSPLTDDERVRISLAVDTLAALRERRIWVRALQLSDAVIEADLSDSVGLHRFYSELRHVQRGPDLLAQVCDEVAVIRRAAGQPAMSREELAARVNLRSLFSISAEPRIGRAVILPPSKLPYMLRETWVGADNWVDQYLRGQPTVYVFATHELADTVYVAIERLADRLFGARLPQGTLEASKRSKDRILELKEALRSSGSWTGHSWSIRPRAQIWHSPQLDKRIAQVALKLSKVETIPVSGNNEELPSAIRRWLEQFESSNDIECALTLLERFEVVDRAKSTRAFDELFLAHPEFRGAYAVSFGEPKDGAVIQGYFADEHAHVVKVVTLDQWSRETDERPLIFVDDCCGSGSQVCDVLAAWLERPDLREPLAEARDAQTKDVQERLRRTKIAFLFIAAWDAGVKKIRERLVDLGLDAVVFSYLGEQSIPFVEDVLKTERAKALNVTAFVDRCHVIGREILKSKGVEPKKVESRKFGYGNKGMLLSTLVNVPTQTVTLIWERGIVDGVPWEPLLPRRKKR